MRAILLGIVLGAIDARHRGLDVVQGAVRGAMIGLAVEHPRVVKRALEPIDAEVVQTTVTP